MGIVYDDAVKAILIFVISLPALGIVGGEPVTDPKYGFNAAWIYQKEAFCSAVIISKRHVLTAAHCVADQLHEVGFESKIHQRTQTIEVINIFRHPQFNPELMQMSYPNRLVNDLAILELKQNIPKGFFPLKIYDRSIKPGEVSLFGYGKTGERGRRGQLRMKKVQIIDYLRESGEWIVSPAACGGDSGGALVNISPQGIVLMGITSRKDKRSDLPGCSAPSVQTDLIHQKAWIQINSLSLY